MAQVLLSTKFAHPPIHESHVIRPRLLTQVQQVTTHPITLVVATAGSGKTTLLSAWCSQLSEQAFPVAWLSLDSEDNDPFSFWQYVFTALNQSLPGIADDALSLLFSAQPPSIQIILTVLLNRLSESSQKLILILDDYHLVETPSIHEALTFFCQHITEGLHLVLVSRHDPPLPLARLRSQQRLFELRTHDLRFTLDETREFFQTTMDLSLSEAEIASLENSSEGWIGALQLAALYLKEQGKEQGDRSAILLALTSSLANHHVIDYLVEEVLAQQTLEVRSFLLQTSILPEMNSALCNELLQRSDSHEMLRLLEQKSLFLVMLDSQRSWYRYHHLFAEVLSNLLRQSAPDQIITLHLKASQWYENHNNPLQAIEQAFLAEDFVRAARIIEGFTLQHGWSLLDPARVERWLDRLSVDLISTRPQLVLLSTWISWRQMKISTDLQARLEALLPSIALYHEQTQEQRIVMAEIGSFLAALAFMQGDNLRALQQAQEALTMLPPTHQALRMLAIQTLINASQHLGKQDVARQVLETLIQVSEETQDIFSSLKAHYHLGVLYERQGKLHQAAAAYRKALQFGEIKYQPGVPAGIYLGLASILLEWLELDTAKALLQQAQQAFHPATDPGIIMYYHQLTAQAYRMTGDFTAAIAALTEAPMILERIPMLAEGPLHQQVKRLYEAMHITIFLLQGNLAIANAWAREYPYTQSEPLSDLRVRELSILARVSLANGQHAEALTLLRPLLNYTKNAQDVPLRISLLLLQALALSPQSTASIQSLLQALSLAEHEEFLFTFVQEGPLIRDLLQSMSFQALLKHPQTSYKVAPAYIERLLAAFDTFCPPAQAPFPGSASAREALSPREIDVLRLMSEGLSDREIAERLTLAESTVKTYAKRIYGKLRVKNRIQATKLAREISLF